MITKRWVARTQSRAASDPTCWDAYLLAYDAELCVHRLDQIVVIALPGFGGRVSFGACQAMPALAIETPHSCVPTSVAPQSSPAHSAVPRSVSYSLVRTYPAIQQLSPKTSSSSIQQELSSPPALAWAKDET